MLIKRQRGFDLPESSATAESLFLERRSLLKAAGFGALSAGAGLLMGRAHAADGDPTADLYPVKRNEAYKLQRPLTDEKLTSTYNNFYEFGSHKQISKRAQDLPTRPWTVMFDGMVEEKREVDIDTLIRAMPLEERLYRHRCVEAWSMTIPWSGFAMKALVDYAKPLGSAKYVEMQTFMDPSVAPGQKQVWYPWPYREGLTIEEATNDLAFLVTGAYGKPMANQYGAPLRLAVPWKYGFKSIKSIVRFTFTDTRPATFWETINKQEYGFWANVNPEIAHPRWSQASEQPLGGSERIPTQLYNGYGEQVAGLYAGMEGEGDRLFR
ncbi:MAG TPA: protein-methionine-sulfoxide reductase catalytic subunit MsrP [Afifellaceae bacterium]|nr:protein-methionine-sulfoxide reductase catalytic subunit MsrP [Afifellaceae bacterium]